MADEPDDDFDEAEIPSVSVQYLSRYAPELPEDYEDLADQELCEEIAQSFAEHIEEFAQSVGQPVTVEVDLDTPPSVEILRPDGGGIEVSVFGDEAFDLLFAPGAEDDGEALELWQLWPGLDRSGLVFLSHMFVERGELDVPSAEADDAAPN